MQSTLEQWFSENQERPVCLCTWGHWFGGRAGEAMFKPAGFEISGDDLIIQFDPTERLVVYRPKGFSVSRRDPCNSALEIATAQSATFGWHYYGRKQVPENWCEETYSDENGMLKIERTGPLLPGTERREKLAGPFILLT